MRVQAGKNTKPQHQVLCLSVSEPFLRSSCYLQIIPLATYRLFQQRKHACDTFPSTTPLLSIYSPACQIIGTAYWWQSFLPRGSVHWDSCDGICKAWLLIQRILEEVVTIHSLIYNYIPSESLLALSKYCLEHIPLLWDKYYDHESQKTRTEMFKLTRPKPYRKALSEVTIDISLVLLPSVHKGLNFQKNAQDLFIFDRSVLFLLH